MTAWLDREDALNNWTEPHGVRTRIVGRPNLIDLCKQGAASVRAGHHDAVRFDVFNGDESDFVIQHMLANYPDVPFYVTRVAGHTERPN